MTSREYCYWLQGFFELNPGCVLSITQTDSIRKHLALVFKHEIDPSYPNQEELNKIHNDVIPFNNDTKLRC